MRISVLNIMLSLLLAFGSNNLKAQAGVIEMDFDSFFQYVLANNLDLIAETYDVSVAEAALSASRVFEDPELEMIFPAFDSDDFSGFPRNIEFEMEIPVDIYGKRRNRIRQAEAEKYAAEADLDDFLRYLKGEAADVYIEVLTSQRVISRMNITLEQLNQLVELNQALLEAGESGEIDVIQTRLEARNYLAEMFDEKISYAELMAEVWFLMGRMTTDSIIFTGDPGMLNSISDYAGLREHALSSRPDIVSARRRVEADEFALRMARIDRLPDISLIAGYHNENATSPMPGFPAFYAGVVIPLRFSGLNSGDYRQNLYKLEQTRTELKSVELDIETGLKSAWDKYVLLSEKRWLFTESILTDAERVRDAVVYSYQTGEVSLLEVLEAQRTMNDVHMNYYETISQYARSVIDLSRMSGVWLIDF